MSHDDPIPVMMRLIEANPNIPQLLSTWKDCIFIVKLLYVCSSKHSADPLIEIDVKLPPKNKRQTSHHIPRTGAFILTLIGKWDDIAKYNYSALKYTVTHLYDHNINNQATFDALREMGRHINACFTHPIAKQMITQANGQASGRQCTFGLVTNVDKTKSNHPTTIINPCHRTQDILSNYDPSYRHTPSVGWLCLFVYWEFCSDYYYHLPIVNLSQHTQFMTTYNPQDLPPAEATAYNALINKWQNEKCKKELSSCIPKPNQLNPYTYVEAWNSVIQPIKDAEAKAALEKQRQKEQEKQQLEQYIKSKSIQQFEEYKRLLLEQQQNDMYNNLYDITIKTDTNNTPRATANETSSFIPSLNNNLNSNDNCDVNSNNTRNNTNTNILPSPSASFQHTLFNEYYYKQYIKSQLDDLTIMNHLQYYQYLSSSSTLSSGITYRPRPHIALPLPSSPSTTTTNTSASPTTSTATSTIDTLIELATALPPPPQSTTTTAVLVPCTNNNVTNSTNAMGDTSDSNNTNNNNINNTNQPTIIIPHQQTTTLNNNNNTSRQQLILLQEQYNNILDQKHILTIQHDDLINKYNTTLQTNETYNKQITTLQQQITTLEEQLQSSNIKIQTLQTQITTLQDEIITLKDEHENEITTLKEDCHRKEIEAKDLVIAAHNNTIDKIYTTTTHNSNNTNTTTTTTEHHHHHLVNNQISFLQQQLQAKDTLYQQQLESKDKQLEAKDKQLESKDQQIALLMQMLAEVNKK